MNKNITTSSMKKLLLLIVGIAFISTQPAVGQSKTGGSGLNSTLSKVETEVVAKYRTVTPGSEAAYAVVINIEQGWHLNAHDPTLDYLIGVNLTTKPHDGVMVSQIEYPASKQVKFDFAQDELAVYQGKAIILVKLKSSDQLKNGDYKISGILRLQACSNKVCLPPATVDIELPLSVANKTVPAGETALFSKIENRDVAASIEQDNQIASLFSEGGYLWAFLSIFLIGLALNLTPCVYPMMSVTVSLFGGSENKNASTSSAFSKALVYVLGIVFMYSSLGVVAAYTGDIFGGWMQSPWVLGGIGVLIFLLSLSMFGLYELQPPAWMMQKLGKTQQTSGYVGHFLSGLLVGVFAAPCIGPPIIALLAFVGSQGSPLFGFLAFFVMALGLGIPYLILGTFSGLLNKMPKSGVWMVWVEKVFGVVLVGVAAFYIILAFAPNYTMYGVLATLVIGGIYLGLLEKSGHEKKIFRGVKMAVGVVSLAVAFMLFQNLQKDGVTWQKYDAELLAQTQKPVILDFYADWCIPCIELDRKTFTDSRVIEKTKSYIRMKVDLTHFDSKRAAKLRKKYDIAGVPTIVFLNGNEQEIKQARIVGFVNADEFIKRLKTVQQSTMTSKLE